MGSLFLGFARVGLFGFGGGPAMIPLMQQECVTAGWVTEEQFLEEKRGILRQVREAVRACNEEMGYALVLDRSAAAASGIPMVVDVRGLDDITAAVMERLAE